MCYQNFAVREFGTQLMDVAENAIAKVHPMAGIGVDLNPDYGAAQRLYVLRGYIPNGRGLRYQRSLCKVRRTNHS